VSRIALLALAILISPYVSAKAYDLVVSGGRVIDPESGLDGKGQVVPGLMPSSYQILKPCSCSRAISG
jgi:hypothetical protein